MHFCPGFIFLFPSSRRKQILGRFMSLCGRPSQEMSTLYPPLPTAQAAWEQRLKQEGLPVRQCPLVGDRLNAPELHLFRGMDNGCISPKHLERTYPPHKISGPLASSSSVNSGSRTVKPSLPVNQKVVCSPLPCGKQKGSGEQLTWMDAWLGLPHWAREQEPPL